MLAAHCSLLVLCLPACLPAWLLAGLANAGGIANCVPQRERAAEPSPPPPVPTQQDCPVLSMVCRSVSKVESFRLLYHVLEIIPAYR